MSRRNRRMSRAAALQLLYFIDVADEKAEVAIQRFWASFSSEDMEQDFVQGLVRGVIASTEQIDALLGSCSEHWRLQRMPRVDRNLLRLACYELLQGDEVPLRVAINEAVELAKIYGSEQSPAFINGVLDHVAKELGRR